MLHLASALAAMAMMLHVWAAKKWYGETSPADGGGNNRILHLRATAAAGWCSCRQQQQH